MYFVVIPESKTVETPESKTVETPESKTVKIPAVVIMVEGGLGTLKLVCESISNNIPVVIIKVSK